MAKNNGIFLQKDLTPAPCGLLNVAEVTTGSGAGIDTWVRTGLSSESYTRPRKVVIFPLTGTASNPESIYTDAGAPSDRFGAIEPFVIEILDQQSTLGSADLTERYARAIAQLEAISQKAVEYELWTGATARSAGTNEPYLTKTGSTILTSGGVSPRKALSLLEQAIATSPTGGSGVIHMTRDVASAISGLGPALDLHQDSNGLSYLITKLGTPVVVGSGYTGSGPIGATGVQPSATNKWAFVTGPVSVFLGDAEAINTASQGFNGRTNDLTVQAQRPASVFFDTSIHAAAQVTVPDLA